MTKQDENQNETANQMTNLLVELTGTKFWSAIKWYSAASKLNIDNVNRSIDPVEKPTEIARNQGMWWGVTSLESFVEGEIESNKQKEEEEAKKRKSA